MAAKRTIVYRGHTIRLWDKSYSIDGGMVIYMGVEPDLAHLKRDVDAIVEGRITPIKKADPVALREQISELDRIFDPNRQYGRGSLRRRLIDWFELHIGVGGDLHRQVWYAWHDYPDAMKLTIALFFALGSLFATLAMIVGAWLIG